MIYYILGEVMKLKKIIEQNNTNADFTLNYDKNKALKKKLHLIGSPITIASFVVALTAFIIIGVFGANIKSISDNTGLLIAMFVLLVIFSTTFGFGLYILRQASFLHLEKQAPEIVEVENEEQQKAEKDS